MFVFYGELCTYCILINTHQYERLCFFPVMQEELSSLFETLSAGVGDDMRRGRSSNTPLLAMDPRRLIELLQICSLIAHGQRHSCLCLLFLAFVKIDYVRTPTFCKYVR